MGFLIDCGFYGFRVGVIWRQLGFYFLSRITCSSSHHIYCLRSIKRFAYLKSFLLFGLFSITIFDFFGWILISRLRAFVEWCVLDQPVNWWFVSSFREFRSAEVFGVAACYWGSKVFFCNQWRHCVVNLLRVLYCCLEQILFLKGDFGIRNWIWGS